jgi:hypothetical protein
LINKRTVILNGARLGPHVRSLNVG